MIIAIPDDYHGLVPQLDCYRRLHGHDVRVLREAAPPFEALVERLRDAEVIVPIRERTVFDRRLLEALPRLRLISQTGRSTHHVDIEACTSLGIAVTAGSHASPYTVAEHTWALILSTLRHIPSETALMRRGLWREQFTMGLHGRTLGVYGLGTIGALVAATAVTFGMRVLVFGQQRSAERARAAGYEVARDHEQLFAESDVLSLHVRLTPATRGIVTAADLARMKPTALLVNTARAELIAPGALAAALRAGRPGYAAVDVYENEPVLGGDHPLLERENATCTPHSAWLERDTYELYFGEAFDNLLAWAAGKPVKLVNPAVAPR
ncbi:MAG TPA: D-2-hydroxyacid dehydrogenase family protein [Burkholderiales bacterium]|nr:D-2-hydroxyacid dehydrogenase family protein [Burkholderiales bacterium]